jgi:hypothetical protein
VVQTIFHQQEVFALKYSEFQKHCRNPKGYVWLHEEDMDIGGGRISREDIDKIRHHADRRRVMISGLRQDTFEYFVRGCGAQLQYVRFFKNKLVEDLSLLGQCKNLVMVDFFHNQRVHKLWDMAGNTNLRGLRISDFSRLHSLKGVETAPNLEHLSFGDAVWLKSRLSDVNILQRCRLKSFSFSGKAIDHINLQIFSQMPNLEILDFRSNMFSTEAIARLMASAPHLAGYSLKPLIRFKHLSGIGKDVLIVGKGKPFLSSKKDAQKVQAYVREFKSTVARYQDQNPRGRTVPRRKR